MALLVAAAVAGYLIGTISFTRILGRLALPGEDLAVTEYAVPGTDETWTYRGVSASSLLERASWQWGVAVILLDAAKAFAPTLALRLAYPDSDAFLVAAIAVIAGHIWPVWWRFLGGRGQSSMLGALLAIDVLAIPVAALAGAMVGLIVFTSVYMARNMGPAMLIPWFWAVADPSHVWFAVGLNIVYWTAVRGDLAEEAHARRARGLAELAYGPRLRVAWHDFFNAD